MKVNKLLIKLFIILSIFSVSVFAKDEMAGTLKGGGKVTIKPKNNYAFSITKNKGMLSSHASYNLSLVNGGDVIYEDKNLVDDVYLVFHDDVLAGDRMTIEVNRGYFDYALTPLLKLPNIVKNVLEPEVIEKAKKQKRVAKKQKKKTVAKKEPVVVAPFIQEKSEEVVMPQEVDVPPLESEIAYESPIGKTFFEKFTKIFKELVHALSFKSITSAQADNRSNQENEKALVSQKEPLKMKATLPHFNDDALKHAATREDERFSKPKRGIEKHFDDSGLQNSATLEESTFTSPKRGLSENFDDRTLQKSARVSKKVFNTPTGMVLDSTIPTHVEEKFSSLRSREPKLYQETLSNKVEKVPAFKSLEPIATDKLQTEARAEHVPHFSNPALVEKPLIKAQSKQESMTREMSEVQEPANTYNEVASQSATRSDDRTQAYPDTGYKEEYKALEPRVSRVQEKSVRQRVIEDTSLPQNATARSSEASDKLVITKIIDKKEPATDPFAGRVLGRMDDRVLGNGYNGAASSAKLGMRVTKNARPVSAWIEVFKNGTKQRVKTFYTSKGRKTKKVKLPAGTYTVRATYRTRDTKQQKTIKGVRLKEGDSVNKSIAFHDGKLRIVARRGDSPLYVKVIAYKSGSRKRVAYDFSSRTSGVATLSLAGGTYDIEVIDHKNNRMFDAIRIRAGKTNTINADF